MSKTLTVRDSKVGFVFSMVIFSIRPHAEFGPYDHGEDAPRLNNLGVISCHNKCFLVIKYGDWVRETLLDILERVDCFPRAKYWKSTQPKHIELATNIIEEIIVPINQSITEFEVEIQFEIMQLLATQICEHLLKYMKQTDYRYSTQVRHLLINGV